MANLKNGRRSIFTNIDSPSRIVTKFHFENQFHQIECLPNETRATELQAGILRKYPKRHIKRGESDSFMSTQQNDRKKVHFQSQILMHVYYSSAIIDFFNDSDS
jgi:hypothetical protein